MSVLGTKLHLPSPRRRLVQRARLTDHFRVNGGEWPRLALVAAPAGFGKTTLLAQWLAAESSKCRVAWLALDSGDADLRVFLTHLVAAIQTAEPEVGVDALALLEAAGATPTDAVLVSLINDLDVLAGPTVVALDDYHVIDDAAVHEAVTFLLDSLPPQVTLAMSTRADPPLPLSRLRARGELVEVRAADLRFTSDEAEVFLNAVMGLQLEPALVAALEARTEGWAAGLQLAALSARSHAGAADGSGDVAGFVEAFSGTHRFVLDYLVEEVLGAQPDEVREFLLETSVLDRLTGGLCDAMTGRSDGHAMLETLERGNLFVAPLDDERRCTATTTCSPTHCAPVSLRGTPTESVSCTPRPADGSPTTGCWPMLSGTRSRAATTNTPPTSSSSPSPICADDARIAPFATGWSRCPTMSSVAGRCSPCSWGGAGSRRGTSTGWRRGSTPRSRLSKPHRH